MRFIGVTGGVGAGKSTVLSYLKEYCSCRIVLADDLAKTMMEPGSLCYDQLVSCLDSYDVWEESGRLCRERLAKVIFSKPEVRTQVNAIVHPAVKESVQLQVDEERRKGEVSYFFFEAALLLEDHYDEICDEIWYIYASEEVRRQRLIESRGYTDEKINNIFASQLSEQVFRSHCHKIIDSSGTMEETRSQIRQILDP